MYQSISILSSLYKESNIYLIAILNMHIAINSFFSHCSFIYAHGIQVNEIKKLCWYINVQKNKKIPDACDITEYKIIT